MSSRTQEYGARIGLLAFSTALVVVLAEVGLRVFLALAEPRATDPEAALELSASANLEGTGSQISLRGLVRASDVPDMVFELKPNLRGTYLGQPLRTSSQMLRDREYSRAKLPGTRRIVGLGDSVMFGWGVAQDEPFLEVLEQRLAQEGDPAVRYEVLNFAVPGYNTAMEVAAFEHRALTYDPDLVIVSFVRNDFKLPHFLQRPREWWSLDRWYLKDLVRYRLRLLESHREQRLLPHDLHAVAPDDRQQAREQYRHMEGAEGFHRAAGRLAELTQERSIPVVFMAPVSTEEPWATARQVAETHGFHLLDAGRYQLLYLIEHGIENTRQAWSEAFWISERDHHPSALSHRLFADALFDQLQTMGWLSSAGQAAPD